MRRILLIVGYLAAMAAIGFAALSIPKVVTHHTVARATKTPLPLALTATATPTATPTPLALASPLPLSQYPADHLVIPALGINASWLPLGMLADGLTMDSPPGPTDLGWYAFTGQPGGDSNAVFAGHVDWYTGQLALFRGIHTLKQGDDVIVSRDDGRQRDYKVVSLSFPTQDADATPIIAATDVPTITLITCTGDFNPVTHEYDTRLVVVAQAPKGG